MKGEVCVPTCALNTHNCQATKNEGPTHESEWVGLQNGSREEMGAKSDKEETVQLLDITLLLIVAHNTDMQQI